MTIKAAVQEKNKHTGAHLQTAPLHFKRILFATDFSSHASPAFKTAARLAQHFGSKLYMVHVIAPTLYAPAGDVFTPILWDAEIKRANEQLARYFARMPEIELVEHEKVIVFGIAKEMIQEVAEEMHIDLAVLGSHGRGGIGKLALGSVAESALRHLRCPVLVCGPQCRRNYQIPNSIMLATDLSIGSLRPAQYASALAAEFRAQLTIVHVLTDSEMDNNQKRRAATEIDELIPAVTELRKKAHYSIRNGDPACELLRIAKQQNTNLIVMGVDEKGIMADHAPWATVSKIVRDAHCPVLAVQPHIV